MSRSPILLPNLKACATQPQTEALTVHHIVLFFFFIKRLCVQAVSRHLGTQSAPGVGDTDPHPQSKRGHRRPAELSRSTGPAPESSCMGGAGPNHDLTFWTRFPCL